MSGKANLQNKLLFTVYYQQLVNGCGVEDCQNEYCKMFDKTKVQEAAAKGIVLSATGPSNLCINATFDTLETMIETANEIKAAGIDEAFEAVCSEIQNYFAKPDLFKSQHTIMTPQFVNFDKIARVFEQIVEAGPETTQALASTLQKLLRSLPSLSREIAAPLLAVVSLALDVHSDPHNFESVVGPLVRAIHSKLTAEGHKTLVNTWASVSPPVAAVLFLFGIMLFCYAV